MEKASRSGHFSGSVLSISVVTPEVSGALFFNYCVFNGLAAIIKMSLLSLFHISSVTYEPS